MLSPIPGLRRSHSGGRVSFRARDSKREANGTKRSAMRANMRMPFSQTAVGFVVLSLTVGVALWFVQGWLSYFFDPAALEISEPPVMSGLPANGTGAREASTQEPSTNGKPTDPVSRTGSEDSGGAFQQMTSELVSRIVWRTANGDCVDLWPEVYSGDPYFPDERRVVEYTSTEEPGTIIISRDEKRLYFVLDGAKAVRYIVGVGRSGGAWTGTTIVGKKEPWPSWPPKADSLADGAGLYLPSIVEGGLSNPLGARVLYLGAQGKDTGYRIHGTTTPWLLGAESRSGCFFLSNENIIDLAKRTEIGAKVIVY